MRTNKRGNHSLPAPEVTRAKGVPIMFIVEWTDHEGNLQQRTFEDRESAELEAAGLEEQYDYVAIIAEMEV